MNPNAIGLISLPMRLVLMLLHYVAFVLPITCVIGGQVPVIDGVIGGVSSLPHNPIESKILINAAANATTPGKLRVVENSGICGK
jgi:hypothetical protein